jgi:hypothetical protein
LKLPLPSETNIGVTKLGKALADTGTVRKYTGVDAPVGSVKGKGRSGLDYLVSPPKIEKPVMVSELDNDGRRERVVMLDMEGRVDRIDLGPATGEPNRVVPTSGEEYTQNAVDILQDASEQPMQVEARDTVRQIRNHLDDRVFRGDKAKVVIATGVLPWKTDDPQYTRPRSIARHP